MSFVRLLAAVIGGCLVQAVWAADSVPVRLVGPERIELKDGGCSFSELPYEIEFTWARSAPLELDLYVINGVVKAGPYVEFTLRDSHGQEAKVMSFVSMPRPPDGQLEVRKEQKVRIPLFAWNGFAEIKDGERYTISATLKAGIGKDSRVDLVSDTRTVIFSHLPDQTRL